MVVRSATGRGRQSLRREAAVLEQVRGAAVVELIAVHDDERTELVLADAGRRTLAGVADLPVATARRAVLAMCDAVGSLHDLGWCHGDLRAEHVLLGPRGDVRLCGLSAARRCVGDDRGRQVDLERLGALASWTLDHGPSRDRRTRRRWRRAARHLDRSLEDRPARDVADLRTRIGAALAPVPVGRRAARLGAGAAAAVLVASAAIALVPVGDRQDVERPNRRSATAAAPTRSASTRVLAAGPTAAPPTTAAPTGDAACPVEGLDVDGDGCDDHVTVDGTTVTVRGRTYRVGAAGDVVAVGDWDCDGLATAAVLRPRTGELFDFRDWASPGRPGRATLTTTVAGGVGLRTIADGACDHRRVIRADGSTVDPDPGTPFPADTATRGTGP